jgi:bifunctional non-homologous end joining protein LigD
MLVRPRTLPTGFIAPCLPTKAHTLPSGGLWLHEIKHDGFRIIARKDGERVRLYSRPGNDFTRRFPLIVEALARLRSRSCIIDGEAVACDDNGVAAFDLVRHHRANESIFLCAFSTSGAIGKQRVHTRLPGLGELSQPSPGHSFRTVQPFGIRKSSALPASLGV